MLSNGTPLCLEEKEVLDVYDSKKLPKCKSHLEIKTTEAPCSFSSNSAQGAVFPSGELHHGGVLGTQGMFPSLGTVVVPAPGRVQGLRGYLAVLSKCSELLCSAFLTCS